MKMFLFFVMKQLLNGAVTLQACAKNYILSIPSPKIAYWSTVMVLSAVTEFYRSLQPAKS